MFSRYKLLAYDSVFLFTGGLRGVSVVLLPQITSGNFSIGHCNEDVSVILRFAEDTAENSS